VGNGTVGPNLWSLFLLAFLGLLCFAGRGGRGVIYFDDSGGLFLGCDEGIDRFSFAFVLQALEDCVFDFLEGLLALFLPVRHDGHMVAELGHENGGDLAHVH